MLENLPIAKIYFEKLIENNTNNGYWIEELYGYVILWGGA
jgi:hypothetical protein